MNSIDFETALEEVDYVYGRICLFRNDLYLGRSLREYGEWAKKELDFLGGLINEGDTVVDAGTFIGTHALAFANFVGPKGAVYAFEPHPTYFHVLQRNLSINNVSNVTAVNAGLSSGAGEMQVLELDVESPNSLGSVRLEPSSAATDVLTVKVIRLDDIGLQACHLIKVDVEGMESQVLSGAKATIERFRPVVYAECNSGDDGWPVVLLMRSFGYVVYLYSELAYNPDNFKGNSVNIFGEARELALVCVPPRLDATFFNKQIESDSLILIETLDDLVLGLIKKPQYKSEVLALTHGFSRWGNEFWKNEPELAASNLRYIELMTTVDECNCLVSALKAELASVNSKSSRQDEELSLIREITERERAAREFEGTEAAKQIAALTEWATSADAYSKSLAEEQAKLRASYEAERTARATEQAEAHKQIITLNHELSAYRSHWIFKLLKHPHLP